MEPDAPQPESKPADSGRREFLTTRLVPAVTVVGALGVVGAAVLRPGAPPSSSAPSAPRDPAPVLPPPAPTDTLPVTYVRVALLAGPGLPAEFQRSLDGIALGGHDLLHVLGDDEVRVLDGAGQILRRWIAPRQAACVGVAADGRVAIGSPGRVDLFAPDGAAVGGFSCGPAEKPAAVTAVRFAGEAILVADAAARVIRRFDAQGHEQGLVGTQNKQGGFMLPNRSLDFDVDADHVIHAADSGRHRVSSWSLDGAPVASFGKFGMARPEDFVGCCNPVNVAVAPDGSVVTAEKAISRLKVFDRNRALVAVIGPDQFDPALVHIHVAVESTGRILAGDPVRRTIAVFQRS